MTNFTRQCFRDDWIALGGESGSCVDRLFEALEAGYSEPGRHFHDRSHVVNLLSHLDQVTSQLDDLASVRVAVWFHDVICVPGESGNEQASADLWCNLAAGSVSHGALEKVANLVLDTRHVVAPMSSDGALLADIDIAGLGAEAALFDQQSQQVSAEFPDAKRAQCEASQRLFLAQLLEREWIYNTAHFRER